MNEDNREKFNYLKEYAKYSNLIFQMVVMVAAGILGGIYLDRLLKMKVPVCTISLTILTTFGAIWYLFRTLLKK